MFDESLNQIAPLQTCGERSAGGRAGSIRTASDGQSGEGTPEPHKVFSDVSSLKQNRRVHPTWQAFIELCRQIGYGEIERLSIQDRLPVLAETVKKKVRFTR